MPSRNTVKDFQINSFYHLYNRGVDKRRIYEDAQDYQTFLYYLKIYLTPSDSLHQELPLLRKNLAKNNLAEEVSLISFCLMPNHFHLLLHQKTQNGITRLMRQLTTAYSMYFNKRYDRVGPLFQGIYKAINVPEEDSLLQLSRYIHLNPIERGVDLEDFKWSSYLTYVGREKTAWVNTQVVLDYLQKSEPQTSYQKYVKQNSKDFTNISDLVLEQD